MMPLVSTKRELPKRRPPRTPRKLAPDDNHSTGTGSSKPGSVHLHVAHELKRDLSDLSGSYYDRTLLSSDHSESSRGWSHAKILSSGRVPKAPQPPSDTDSVAERKGITRSRIQVMDSSDVVELVTKSDIFGDSKFEIFSDPFFEDHHHRIPLVVLLMDPGKNQYEFIQIWIDVAVDTVRDILMTIQQNIKGGWKQDYDGLFQVRNNRFDQLINILPVSKYDARSHEIWVAKPWGVSTKSTMAKAASLLKYLRDLNVIENAVVGCSPSSSAKIEEKVLILSNEAQQRVFVPEGILKHHHAVQFLTFSPPFERSVRVDVLAGGSIASSEDGSQLSDSQYGNLSLDSGKPPLPPRAITKSVTISTVAKGRVLESDKSILFESDKSIVFEAPRENVVFEAPRESEVPLTRSRLGSASSETTEKQGNRYVPSSEPRCFDNIFASLNCRRRRREAADYVFVEPTWQAWDDASVDRSEASRQPLLVNGNSGLRFDPILQ